MPLLDALTTYIDIDELQLRQLSQVFTSVQFGKGELIFRPNESYDRLFFLIDGLVRCYYLHDDREINLRLITDNSAVLPFASYITKSPSDEYVQCLSDCQGYFVRFEDLKNVGVSPRK